MRAITRLRILPALLLALLACRTRPVREESGSTGPPLPWTLAFQKEAALVADEIRVEGPQDLLGHVAIRQDPDVIDYHMETTPAGLLQELRVKPDAGAVAIQAQLDAWSLAAFRRLVVLQRPGEVPVTVRALGNAAWIPAQGNGERRAESLTFQGVRGK